MKIMINLNVYADFLEENNDVQLALIVRFVMYGDAYFSFKYGNGSNHAKCNIAGVGYGNGFGSPKSCLANWGTGSGKGSWESDYRCGGWHAVGGDGGEEGDSFVE